MVAAHGLGGTVGALLTGVFAAEVAQRPGRRPAVRQSRQLLIQAVAVGAAIVFSGVMSFVLLKAIGLVIPLRVDDRDESTGLDVTQHGEEAYIHDSGAGAVRA